MVQLYAKSQEDAQDAFGFVFDLRKNSNYPDVIVTCIFPVDASVKVGACPFSSDQLRELLSKPPAENIPMFCHMLFSPEQAKILAMEEEALMLSCCQFSDQGEVFALELAKNKP